MRSWFWRDETFSDSQSRAVILFHVLILLELWAFSGAFQKFFTHDSLFYMTHIAHSWREFLPYILTPSTEMSYRPLNLAIVALLYPTLGVDPYSWHWVPIAFHVANTLLFYLVARRISMGPTAALAAAGFWGLHSVAGWVTYDITYLSDFLLAFLLLAAIFLAIEARRHGSRLLAAAALVAFTLSLLTKEAAVTFPLAIWIALVLADVRSSGQPTTAKEIVRSVKQSVPFISWFLAINLAFTALYGYWLWTGRIYAQGAHAAYNINPFSNLLGKANYFYWALNLPSALHIPNAERNFVIAFGVMACLLAVWALDVLRRRGKLSWIEWAGLLWFVGLNVPSLLLSQRLAKWYLYIPLLGVALAFGVLAENLRSLMISGFPRSAGLVIPVILIGPVLFSSHVQTRSYLARSDAVYESDLLESCLTDFRHAHPSLPAHASLFFLPAFEEGVSNLLAADPIGHGELFQMYYPDTQVEATFAHRGQPLPENIGARSDVFVLQFLDHHLYDVTQYFKSSGKMTLYLLPTPEKEIAPLLKKEPAGGRRLYQKYVQLTFADAGAHLPDDYLAHRDIWVLQYQGGHFDDVTRYYINGNPDTLLIIPTIDGRPPRLRPLEEDPETAGRLGHSHVVLMSFDDLNRLPPDYASRPDLFFVQFLGGRFTDITNYYKGRHADGALRVVRNLDRVSYSVNRAEFYPNYERFDTPTGIPVFFPTAEKEILTQIGGSIVTIPLPKVARDSRLRFDVSWMYDQGDGGWAEAAVRSHGKETVVYREYMTPDPKKKSLQWKEVRVDLQGFVEMEPELILKCYNDPGKNTVADWLNWRDIVMESNK